MEKLKNYRFSLRILFEAALVFSLIILSFNVYCKNPLSKDINSVKSGKELYNKRCSNCHGINAQGKNNGFFVSPNLKKFNKGYRKFINILVYGYGRMPAWGGLSKLTEKELNQLAAYLENITDEESNW